MNSCTASRGNNAVPQFSWIQSSLTIADESMGISLTSSGLSGDSHLVRLATWSYGFHTYFGEAVIGGVGLLDIVVVVVVSTILERLLKVKVVDRSLACTKKNQKRNHRVVRAT